MIDHYLEYIKKELDSHKIFKNYVRKIIDKLDNDNKIARLKFEESLKTLNINESILLNVMLEKNNNTTHFRNMLINLLNENYEGLEEYYLEEREDKE